MTTDSIRCAENYNELCTALRNMKTAYRNTNTLMHSSYLQIFTAEPLCQQKFMRENRVRAYINNFHAFTSSSDGHRGIPISAPPAPKSKRGQGLHDPPPPSETWLRLWLATSTREIERGAKAGSWFYIGSWRVALRGGSTGRYCLPRFQPSPRYSRMVGRLG